MIKPIRINKYSIYDIFHNDNNKIVIITPFEKVSLNIKYNNILFNKIKCKHNHTYVYFLNNETEYKKNIELNINNDIIKTGVNKYSEYKDKILIVETLWRIIYSNKKADIYEANLMRRLGGLMYIDNKIMGNIKDKIKKECQ